MPGLMHNRRWELLPCNKEDERLLCEQLGLVPLVARVLCARGICDAQKASEFLNPSLERDWANPLDIPGMREAADRVQRALEDGERIAVFGDFDVDGMTSTCLLTQALRRLGAEVHPFIPHRFGEGYGLSQDALNRVIACSHPDLVITVDNGIASKDEVAWLVAQGVDVVVTDHHEPGDLVPEGVPVTDPKLDANGYSRELAGVGVALKLVCELGCRLGQPDLWREFTDLAALGTVSDMMRLEGENRSLVADGIEHMRHSTRPGIIALAATAGVELADLRADNLPFTIIPRLNAAGRMSTTDVAFDLLICEDHAEAATLAGMLDRTNTERRETEARLSEEALERLSKTYAGERIIVLAGEGWHEGVKGIVASRVVSRYHVPTIIFTISEGIARGSGRSVGSVDLFHAVEQCSDLLVRFGGHAGAVGVTCEVQKLDALKERLEGIMQELPDDEFVDKGEVTALASLSELTLQNIAALDALQPFGQGNKRPLFGLTGVFMTNRARVGYGNSHMRFLATDGVSSVPAIMFRVPNIERASSCDELVDLVADVVNESWQGRVNPKLMVSDICYREAPAQGEAEPPIEQQSCALAEAAAADADACARTRKGLERLSAAGLVARLRQVMIGSSPLLPAQDEALRRLAAGTSTLCVMATGRGKSLIFHLHAAVTAIRDHKASVFVYPLRALVSDQAFHLEDSFARMGLVVRVLTGETPQKERLEVYHGLACGAVDVILTTPEYLAIHSRDLAKSNRIGFLVVDEAHHVGTAGATDRSAYVELPRIRSEFGEPVSLAVTATASTPVSREICRLLGIDANDVILDRSVRSNLSILDYRRIRDRDSQLASLVATGQKTVVYVNSRNQAQMLVRTLRASVPELGHRIAFYHAGLSRELRLRIEDAFRGDQLCCIVSTSAFGEGVNLPGIRNVVLYHLPFGATEFNQMSGRAGRDGKEAHIVLLYGSRDARLNETILEASSPSRDDLALLYRMLKQESQSSEAGEVVVSDAVLLSDAKRSRANTHLSEAAIEVGIQVFGELGFLQSFGEGDTRRIVMAPSPERVDLSMSLRYAEGLRAAREFGQFRDWALTSMPQEMLSSINRPIVPGFGHTVDR